ncbi:MAG TPA: hypothetical protein H9772_06395, partial [Candidatus Oscillibacter pullicola]|nr:hypothetical protein [Candidatus Oscillibacter pullicola]
KACSNISNPGVTSRKTTTSFRCGCFFLQMDFTGAGGLDSACARFHFLAESSARRKGAAPRIAEDTAPPAYAVRLRGRVPADAALTKMYGKMTDFFGEKDGKNRKSFTKNIQEPAAKTCYNNSE